jgi:hypothetical protein
VTVHKHVPAGSVSKIFKVEWVSNKHGSGGSVPNKHSSAGSMSNKHGSEVHSGSLALSARLFLYSAMFGFSTGSSGCVHGCLMSLLPCI